MSEQLLRDVFSIRGRFHRSVQLERDWQDQRGLQDYLPTPTARELALQIVQGAISGQGPRAWSLTGPYGSGKSAFALFLTDLLANETPRHEQAQSLRAEWELSTRRFAAVPIVGQRASLAPTLIAGIQAHAESLVPQLTYQAEADIVSSDNGNRTLSTVFERAATAARVNGYEGLLVIVDEFGKFLEYAAQNPDTEDLLILQDLAETATRSNVPIILVTILHSAFDEYLGPLDEARRVEWQKVQGRFADVAFLEPPEQFLRLIGTAIDCKESEAATCGEYSRLSSFLAGSQAAGEARRRMSLEAFLPSCAPLHPWTALLLWPLFRSKLAQNERSLFAFLMDRGPYGFQDFLNATPVESESPIFYTLDLLYDYVATTLGPAALLGNQARRWAEIMHAVDRVPTNAPRLARAVVKTVGLLGLYGAPVGLRASQEALGLAFAVPGEVSKAIEFLEQLSIIVYRKHEKAYGLWEGSDVDLDEAYENALHNIGKGRLAGRLKRAVSLRAQVAKAHYIRSGTLRYFTVDAIDGSKTNIKAALKKPLRPADGRISFVITTDQTARNELIEYAKELTEKSEFASHLQLLAFPKPMIGLEKALLEVEAWKWVQANTQRLQGDPVAKAEVKSRIIFSQRRLQDIAGPALNLRGYLFAPEGSDWIQAGQRRPVKGAVDFQKWLSQLCDEVYSKAPSLHNELLNRENLSSAATAARRVLVESMIEHEQEPNLGIEGTPAEYSMYRAMLAEGGFHRKVNGQWRFATPKAGWLPIWQAIEGFVKTTESGRRPLAELLASLKQPPYGLREGPIPVLIAAFLLSQRDEIALYEDGLFVPEIRIEVFERLMRSPETFEVQRHRLTAAEQKAFTAVAEMLQSIRLSSSMARNADLLNIVRPLVVFAAQLPYYSRRTKHMEPINAIALRDVLLKARDPYELMFRQVPEALGVSINERSGVAGLVNALKAALAGLQHTYSRLLDNIEQQLRDAFGLYGISIEAKQQLTDRATPLIGYAADRRLDLFVREASRLANRDWREVLARVVNKGIPPSHWSDVDVIDFQVRLRQLASDFTRLEELVAEKRISGSSAVLRIGWLDGDLEEDRAVITVPPESILKVEGLSRQIEEILEAELDSQEDGYRLHLAAIARVAQRYLRSSKEAKHE